MGQNESSRSFSHSKRLTAIEKAFQQNGCTIKNYFRYNDYYGVIGETNVPVYSQSNINIEVNIENILSRNGPKKCVLYASGDAYTMGYQIGSLVPHQVESVTTFIRHIAPQFITNDIDHMSLTAPLIYRLVYKALTQVVIDLITKTTVQEFYKAHHAGHIPESYLQELKGLRDGCLSRLSASPLTLESLIVANYGIEVLIASVYSGKLERNLQEIWKKLPVNVHRAFPQRPETLSSIPDMCNAIMISGEATKSNASSYLLRDFQFANAHTYDRYCTIIVRNPVGKPAFMGVSMPGFIGYTVFLSSHSVCGGMNMVRSTAVDIRNLGLGSILTCRYLAENARTSAEVEQLLHDTVRGNPWLYYAIDKTGDSHVYESIPKKWDDGKSDLTQLSNLPEKLWTDIVNTTSYQPGKRKGLVDRFNNDYPIKLWSLNLIKDNVVNKYQWQNLERWNSIGSYLFDSWTEESDALNDHMNMYFTPTRLQGDNVKIVTNNFIDPIWRTTQMNKRTAIAELSSTGNQWRYDRLCELIQEQYGQIDIYSCLDILEFLSPWKEADYPQNIGVSRRIPDFYELIERQVNPNVVERKQKRKRQERFVDAANEDDFVVGYQNNVVITGSLSVVDVKNMTIYNKSGYWGNDYYSLSLKPFLFVPT